MSTSSIEKLNVQIQQERKLVSFDSYDMTVRQLLDMVESGDIFVPPEYQRKFVWGNERESELIESIFLGIPVPSLYMATNPDSTWEIVDGVQRLSTLVHYAGTIEMLSSIPKEKHLIISELQKLTALNGFSFEALPKSLQLMFTTRPIRVTVLNDKSDLSVRFDLFERLNTGGVSLTDQEIRNCVYRGPFNNDIKELSQIKPFTNTVKLKPIDQHNGTAEEMVLRYFAYMENYKVFDHSVRGFLNDYMKSKALKPIQKKLSDLFKKTFTTIQQALPDGIIRNNRSITPVNLYEAISVGIGLALSEGKSIKQDKIASLLSDVNLRNLTTGATNSKKMVTGRIDYVKDNVS